MGALGDDVQCKLGPSEAVGVCKCAVGGNGQSAQQAE